MIHRRDFLAASGAAALSTAAPAAFAQASEDARLRALLDRFFEEQVNESPEQATSLGLDEGPRAPLKARLDERSPQERSRDLARARERQAALRGIDRAKLTGMSVVDYDVVAYQLGRRVEVGGRFPYGYAYGNLQPYVVTQRHGAYQDIPDFLDSQHSIEDRADAEAYLARLRAFSRALDQDLQVLAADSARGVIPPSFTLDTAIGQIEQLRGTAPAESVMVRSIARRTAEKSIPGDWGGQAAAIVQREVYPALDRHLQAVRAIRARADDRAGVWKLPEGEAYYAAAVMNSTTTKMTPDEVHRLGVQQVAEITAEMDKILRSQGLTQGTVAERVIALGDKPENLYPNTDEGRTALLAALNGQIRALDPQLPKLFGRLPKAGVEVRRVPPFIEAGASNGYYQRPTLDGSRPGVFYINLKDTKDWPKFTLETLTYHEASPGHHLQVALQQESEAIPLLRRTGGFSAYSEGWALYAEQLADELGVYADDPLGRLGYLQSFLFRAARLVVDTGIHGKRWTREQATNYLRGATGYSQPRTQREIDRYTVMPGQALSYKVGHTVWVRTREDAKRRLGERFDIKGFHDTALAAGAMPLTVLEARVADWVKSRQA
ncbi:MAG TPA: DUF885 family protein [Caulobacteraceae bacterium]|jgi:uncharacterized protein (DUF885 family)